ncbi:SecY-interacting protein [Aeromonas cavernicola]|uniref:Protein Syd n=1 Tax=Aeromonas cavernicola TaxID=1006623 RepID=A0A2H9U921_9GAMM|nr:SecY-interacting protein [Aeromonas cavernicola]PJG60540.1 SecY-interacting protein [Aeromonas cavernicola]
MSDQVLSALTDFLARWQQHREQRYGVPRCDWDAEWRSVCEVAKPNEGKVAWRPYHRAQPEDFSAIAAALELTLHPSALALFGHWFSRPIPCLYKGLRLELIFPWNEEDLELLKENLIGHLLMLRKLKRPPSIFIATTRHENTLISLDNESGQVWLEWLDSGRRLSLALSLPAFLARLETLPH